MVQESGSLLPTWEELPHSAEELAYCEKLAAALPPEEALFASFSYWLLLQKPEERVPYSYAPSWEAMEPELFLLFSKCYHALHLYALPEASSWRASSLTPGLWRREGPLLRSLTVRPQVHTAEDYLENFVDWEHPRPAGHWREAVEWVRATDPLLSHLPLLVQAYERGGRRWAEAVEALLAPLPAAPSPGREVWPTTYEKAVVYPALLEVLPAEHRARAAWEEEWWRIPYDADFMDVGMLGTVEALYLLRLLGFSTYEQVVTYLHGLYPDSLPTAQEWPVFLLERGEELSKHSSLPLAWWFPLLYPSHLSFYALDE